MLTLATCMHQPQYGVHPPPTGDNSYEYASPDICMQHTSSAVTTYVFVRNKEFNKTLSPFEDWVILADSRIYSVATV